LNGTKIQKLGLGNYILKLLLKY